MDIVKKIAHVVTAEEAPYSYNGECYAEGQTVMVRPFEECAKEIPLFTKDALDDCWPDYCSHKGAYPKLNNRNQYDIPAGETVQITIPVREGCKAPGRVFFNWCGACFAVDFDKDPAEGTVTDLTAPVINPRFLSIADEDGVPAPTVLHVTNKGETTMCLSAAFYC